ncbi:MAG: XTP/dITP diphosphatase [Bacillota bacterium]|jgi:XTP/dITP diphosphohydrolase
MPQIVLASSNRGKIAEFAQLLQPLGWQVLATNQFDLPPIEEDGDTFFENARKKAETVCRATGLPTIADDSGLVVHYLGGAPGVYSARFAGEDADDKQNNLKLLQLMEGVPERKRQAHFTSVLAWARPDSATRLVCGRCFGSVAMEERGERGFGYDPLFQVDELQQTFAEMDLQTKNRISHRSKAMARLLELIKSEKF